MKFSIVIPVYNVAPYLRECLDSVLNQTYTDWECICVDDGSTDGSGEILDEYAAKDKRFKVIHQKNQGVSAARNAALEVARGEWFFFVDSDDSICHNTLEVINGWCQNNHIDAICVDNNASNILRNSLKIVRRIDLFCGRYVINGLSICKFYRLSKFRQIRFLTGMRYREDFCFLMDALSVDAKWAVADFHYYNYRTRRESASASIKTSDFKDLIYCHIYGLEVIRHSLSVTRNELLEHMRTLGKKIRSAPYFALERWRWLTTDERGQVTELMQQTIDLVGFNPYDVWIRWLMASIKCRGLLGDVTWIIFFRRGFNWLRKKCN